MLQKIVPYIGGIPDGILILRAARALHHLERNPDSKKVFVRAVTIAKKCDEKAMVRASFVRQAHAKIAECSQLQDEASTLVMALAKEIDALEAESNEACVKYVERQMALRMGRDSGFDTLEDYAKRISDGMKRGDKICKLNRMRAKMKRQLKKLGRKHQALWLKTTLVDTRASKLAERSEQLSLLLRVN